MKKNILKKVFAAGLIIPFALSLGFFGTSCLPELTFGDLVICESIDEQTGEPVNPRSEFDFEVEKIFAAIKVSGVRGEDNYRFALKDSNTGSIIYDVTEKYSGKEKGFIELYVYMESEDLKEGEIILEPGEYMVEFYHKGELIEETEFEIKKPQAEVLEVVLARGINEENEPVNATSVFEAADSFYACVELNYYLIGDNLTVRWYLGEDELIDESSMDISENHYLPAYTAFQLQTDENNPWPAGLYRVEIYLNENLHGKYEFEVKDDSLTEGTAAVSFNEGNLYSNENYGFSISYPDRWAYEEFEEEEEGVFVVFTPDSLDIPISISVSMLMEGGFDPDNLEQFAYDTITAALSESEFDRNNLNIFSGELFGYYYEEYIYSYIDNNDIETALDLILILKDSELFVFLGVAAGDYINISTDAFVKSLSTVKFF